MEFNYARNIPDLQEPWMHSKRVVLPLRLTPHTHRIICRFGVVPHRTERIVGRHRVGNKMVYVVRNAGLGKIPPF